MSIYAISWVLQHSTAEKIDRLVLIALADYARDDGGGAFPAVANIAKKARVSERAAQYALRRLEAAGHIEKSGKTPKGTNVYRILMGVQGVHPGGVQERAEGGADFDRGVHAGAPNPSIDPLEEKQPSVSVDDRIQKAFDHWLTIIGDGVEANRYRLTSKRKKNLKARLADSDATEIHQAMLGAWADPWCQETGQWDIAYVLRDRDLLEKYRDKHLARNGNGHRPSANPEYDTTVRNPELETA